MPRSATLCHALGDTKGNGGSSAHYFFFNFLFCIGVQPINNVVKVSGEQRRD